MHGEECFIFIGMYAQIAHLVAQSRNAGSVLKLRSYNRATNATSQAMKNFSNNSSFCFKKSRGLQPYIAKEITEGWLSQGDYNKLIHMFKACTQSNAAGAK